MKSKNLFLVLFFSLFLCGCVSGPPKISQFEPFNEYVGKTLKLEKPVYLWKESEDWLSRELVIYEEWDNEYLIRKKDPWGVKLFTELPKGTEINLFYVEAVGDLKGGNLLFIAHGQVTDSRFEKHPKFRFIWGDYVNDEIDKAPWDESNIPEKRKISKSLEKFLEK